MEEIFSRQNPRFKSACKLLSARGRQKQGRILIIGNREVVRAARSGLQFEEIFLSERIVQLRPEVNDLSNSEVSNSEVPNSEEAAILLLLDQITNPDSRPVPRIAVLNESLFSELAYGDRQVDIIGVANRPSTSLADLPHSDSSAPSLLIVLESLEKPGNLGAIARSADGCGSAGIVLADPLTDIYHPNSIRSSVATVFSVPIATASSAAIVDWMVKNKRQVLIASPEAEKSLYDIEMSTQAAIVLGNEAQGVSLFWRKLIEHQRANDDFKQLVQTFRVPMKGIGDSLNVAVTGSIIIYEWLRRNESADSQ